MLKGYDARMKEEQQFFDTAMARVQTGFDSTKSMMKQKVGEVTTGLNPEKLIRENPWPAALGALGLGAATATVLRFWIFPKHDVRYVQAPPQRVVVEVAGKNYGIATAAQVPQPAPAKSTAWLQNLVAIAGHIPVVMEKAQKIFAEFNRHKETQDANAPVTQSPEPPLPKDEPFKKTMSRRMAPPPFES